MSQEKKCSRCVELEKENESLRAECGLRQIQGFKEGMERAAVIADENGVAPSWRTAEAIREAMQTDKED